jgi:hypothetical protein
MLCEAQATSAASSADQIRHQLAPKVQLKADPAKADACNADPLFTAKTMQLLTAAAELS